MAPIEWDPKTGDATGSETREEKDARRALMFPGWNEPLSKEAEGALLGLSEAFIEIPLGMGVRLKGAILANLAAGPGVDECLKKAYMCRSPLGIAIWPDSQPTFIDTGVHCITITGRGQNWLRNRELGLPKLAPALPSQ